MLDILFTLGCAFAIFTCFVVLILLCIAFWVGLVIFLWGIIKDIFS